MHFETRYIHHPDSSLRGITEVYARKFLFLAVINSPRRKSRRYLKLPFLSNNLSHRPYFEVKARFNQILDDQKRQVQLIEETIVMTKNGYSDSLKELEKISEEIHHRRAQRRLQCQKNIEKFGIREPGVGCESPSTPMSGSQLAGNRLCLRSRHQRHLHFLQANIICDRLLFRIHASFLIHNRDHRYTIFVVSSVIAQTSITKTVHFS